MLSRQSKIFTKLINSFEETESSKKASAQHPTLQISTSSEKTSVRFLIKPMEVVYLTNQNLEVVQQQAEHGTSSLALLQLVSHVQLLVHSAEQAERPAATSA